MGISKEKYIDIGNDKLLIQKAIELYYDKTFTKPEVIETTTEHKEHFYLQLIKKD